MVNSFCKAEDFQAISLYKDMEGVYLIKFSKEAMMEPVLDPETGEPTGEIEDSGLVCYTEEILYGEPTVEEIRKIRIKEVEEYDQSPDVNGFYLNGELTWIPYNLRDNYLLTLQGAKRQGIETVKYLGYEGISVDMAIQMIDMVNIYAMNCTDVTNAHKANLEALDTIEELLAYNIKTGYPEKLVFNINQEEE